MGWQQGPESPQCALAYGGPRPESSNAPRISTSRSFLITSARSIPNAPHADAGLRVLTELAGADKFVGDIWASRQVQDRFCAEIRTAVLYFPCEMWTDSFESYRSRSGATARQAQRMRFPLLRKLTSNA